jgi:hypothetical protein
MMMSVGVMKDTILLRDLPPHIGGGLVYYESIEREIKTRPIYECRCDERLKN